MTQGPRYAYLAALIGALTLGSCALVTRATAGGMTEEQAAVCEAAGGCMLVTREQVLELAQRVYDKGVADANRLCRNRT